MYRTVCAAEAGLQVTCRVVRQALEEAAKDSRYAMLSRELTGINLCLSGVEYYMEGAKAIASTLEAAIQCADNPPPMPDQRRVNAG